MAWQVGISNIVNGSRTRFPSILRLPHITHSSSPPRASRGGFISCLFDTQRILIHWQGNDCAIETFLLQDQTAAHYIVIQVPVSEFEQQYGLMQEFYSSVAGIK